MTWPENDKALLQAHYVNGILYPSLLINQRIDHLELALGDVEDKDSVVKPDMATGMNDRLVAKLKIAYPNLHTAIDAMKEFDWANITRKTWTTDE